MTEAMLEHYQRFLQKKMDRAKPVGFEKKPEDINPMLFPWQRDIDSWALIGIELKPSYYQQAVNNCKNAVIEDQVSLFDGIQEG